MKVELLHIVGCPNTDVAEANARGGVHGRQLELDVADARAGVRAALNAWRERPPFALIGGLWNESTEAADAVLAERHLSHVASLVVREQPPRAGDWSADLLAPLQAQRAVLAEGQRVLINNPQRFDGVTTIGVDEHVWRHTRRGDKYVTVIIDLTGPRTGKGPARLLDMVEGRSKQVFANWLDQQSKQWRDGVQIVAMDGFTGFKTAAAEKLPDAVEVMDPFHVVQLAGDALDRCRQRVQHETLGHRGRSGDPLYGARRTLHTGTSLLTNKQKTRLETLFADEDHAAVEITWRVYQDIVTAYRDPDPQAGRTLLNKVIESIARGVPAALAELRKLGSTLNRRAGDILAYFDHPRTSNGPTEAINGRLEHLRGSALGFRNLTNYIARSLLETGGFRPQLHPGL